MHQTLATTARPAIETFAAATQNCCVPLSLDEVDHELLALLQRDSGRTLRQLGDLVALSPSAVKRRIDRYRKHGVIARQVTVLNPNRLPTALLAVCLITLEHESGRLHQAFRDRLLAAPEV